MLPQASEALMTIAERLRGEGRQEGRKEGREENQRENLIRLLILRFGPQSDVVLARIRRADFALMERWFERGVTASSLEAVFDDSP
jgi:predicted transposase YdaD